MRVYRSTAIRNVAFVGHGAAGKTSLVDALAFVAGCTKRRGSIPDGTTLTDYSADEIQRQHSISLGLAFAEWADTKINLLDAPGFLDFLGDATAALHSADAAVVVLNATGGVEVGTEKVWEICDRLHLPRLLFIGQMDRERADFARVFDDVRAHLSPKVVPVEIPIGNGADFHGIVNLLTDEALTYRKGTKTGEYDTVALPDDVKETYARYHDQLVEAIAATDDALLEKYLAGEELSRGEIIAGLRKGVLAGEIVPMLVGSATLTYGMRQLLTEIVDLLPSPAEAPIPGGESDHEGNGGNGGSPLLGHVFKTISEPHVGDVTLFRLYRGGVKSGEEVWNHEHGVAEKLNHLSLQQGRERVEVLELSAGDIGSVAKLRDTHTNDTFCRKERSVHLEPIPYPESVATAGVVVKNRGEEDRLVAGLHRLHEEDPTFHFEYSSELGQTLIHGMGERHFEIVLGRLEKKFGVHAELVPPRVAYREALTGEAEGRGKHKKQSGGRGQYGDCWIRLAPRPRGAGYEFVDAIKGGVIPNKYIPAVDRGIQEAAARGVIAGYPLVDFRAECFDGSYHDVDSNEMSFKMAGILAFRAVAPQAGPVLLEPLLDVTVWAPGETMGEVIGDLSSRRGHILGTDRDGRLTRIKAVVPEAEMYKYATTLHSITHGRGTFHQEPRGYAEAPPEVTARVAAEHGKDDGDEG